MAIVYMGYMAASSWTDLCPPPETCPLSPGPLTPKQEIPVPNT